MDWGGQQSELRQDRAARPGDGESGQAHKVLRPQKTQQLVIGRMSGRGRGRFVAGGANHQVGNREGGVWGGVR